MTQDEAVQNGIRFLKFVRPNDWRERIGDEPFTEADMKSSQRCPLGRTGAWDAATPSGHPLNLSEHGFNPLHGVRFDRSAKAWNKALGLK